MFVEICKLVFLIKLAALVELVHQKITLHETYSLIQFFFFAYLALIKHGNYVLTLKVISYSFVSHLSQSYYHKLIDCVLAHSFSQIHYSMCVIFFSSLLKIAHQQTLINFQFTLFCVHLKITNFFCFMSFFFGCNSVSLFSI